MRARLVAVALAITTGCFATPHPPRTSGGAPQRDGDPRNDLGHGRDDDDDDDEDQDQDQEVDRDDRADLERDDLEHDAALRGLGRHPRRVGPRISDVLAAAYVAAGLDRSLGGGFALRARLGGLVPWVSARTGRDTSWHDEDPDVGRGTTLEIRATWRLDRLVFDGRELQVVALEAARRRERRRLATHVIRTYFVWKRSASRADEAAAELDALTNGWFSEAKQRSASETRTVHAPAATP